MVADGFGVGDRVGRGAGVRVGAGETGLEATTVGLVVGPEAVVGGAVVANAVPVTSGVGVVVDGGPDVWALTATE